jgi:hypothetical protein
MEGERDRLMPERVSAEEVERQKRLIIELAGKLRAIGAYVDPPFEVKQRILKVLVDQIVINVREGWFRLEGTIRGIFVIDNIPVHM